jgi:hypothetical protein
MRQDIELFLADGVEDYLRYLGGGESFSGTGFLCQWMVAFLAFRQTSRLKEMDMTHLHLASC